MNKETHFSFGPRLGHCCSWSVSTFKSFFILEKLQLLFLLLLSGRSELDVTTLHSTIRTKGAQQPPHEQINQSRQLVHLQDCFQTAHISPIKQECEGSESTEPQSSSSPITSLDQSDFRRNAEERSTPSVPRSPTCDVMVSTEPEPRVSALTQTEDPKTADKHVNTDVYMTDLDNLAVVRVKPERCRLLLVQQNLTECFFHFRKFSNSGRLRTN